MLQAYEKPLRSKRYKVTEENILYLSLRLQDHIWINEASSKIKIRLESIGSSAMFSLQQVLNAIKHQIPQHLVKRAMIYVNLLIVLQPLTQSLGCQRCIRHSSCRLAIQLLDSRHRVLQIPVARKPARGPTPQRRPSWSVFTPERPRSPDNLQLTLQHRQQ